MQPETEKRKQRSSVHGFYLKSGAALLLVSLCLLVIACGGTSPATNNADQPSLNSSIITATIQLGNINNGITPVPQPAYTCQAWATRATPPINMTTIVGVNAKFTHNVQGNPEGVGGASAVATISWGTGSMQTPPVITTADGLAVFSIDVSNQQDIINREFIVSVTFTKSGVQTCTTPPDQNAFFTLVMASPTADNGNNNCNNNNGNNNNGNGNNKKHHHNCG